MDFTADIDIFLTDLGTAATYTPAGWPAAAIRVIFANAHQVMEMLAGGVGFETTGPQALCKTSEVAAAKHGDTLVIDSKFYYVTGVEPDGTGMTKLLLSEDLANV